jgi:hypothetical protein
VATGTGTGIVVVGVPAVETKCLALSPSEIHTHSDDPMWLASIPGSQGWQVMSAVAPSAVPYMPMGHMLTHPIPFGTPVALLQVPGSQGVHLWCLARQAEKKSQLRSSCQ